MHRRKCRDEPATGHAVRHPERERGTNGRRAARTFGTHPARARVMLSWGCTGGRRHGTGCATDKAWTAPPHPHGTATPAARHGRDTTEADQEGWTPHVQGPRKRRIPEPATQGTPQPSSCRAARARRRKHRPRRATASEILAHRKSLYFGDKHHTELICARAGIPWPLPVHSTSSRTSKHAISICHERTFHHDNESVCSCRFYNIHQEMLRVHPRCIFVSISGSAVRTAPLAPLVASA